MRACVCASRPAGPRPGGAAALLPRRLRSRAGPRGGYLGPRASAGRPGTGAAGWPAAGSPPLPSRRCVPQRPSGSRRRGGGRRGPGAPGGGGSGREEGALPGFLCGMVGSGERGKGFPGLSARGWRAVGGVGRGGGHLSVFSTRITGWERGRRWGERVKMK